MLALQLPLQHTLATVIRPRSPHVLLLVLACLALCGALLAACGGGDDEQADSGDARAQQLLTETFAGTRSAVENARMRLAFRLDPEGLLRLGGPIKLNVSGRFAAPRLGELPLFDVDFAGTLATHRFTGGARSTGTRAFIRLDDRFYSVDSRFVSRLRAGQGSEPRSGLRALGFDPRRWIRDPRVEANERVAGVDTIRIGGSLDVKRLLGDLDNLLTNAGGPVGDRGRAGDPVGEGGLLTPQLREQIAGAVDSASADIWTGASDKRVRQLHAVIKFRFKANGGVSPIRGLDGGTIDLRLRLDDVNATTVDVRAPTGAPPLSSLTGRSIDDFISGVRIALTGSGADDGLIGAALSCITGSGGETAPLVACISKLAP